MKKLIRLGASLAVLMSVALMASMMFAATVSADSTVTWTGQGVSNGQLESVECDEGPNTPGTIHWVFTATGATSATITINGVAYPMTQGGSGSGAFHYYSAWVDLDTVTASATAVGSRIRGNPQLVISHGCPYQLEVEKTATGSFDREWTWTIDKSSDFAGQSEETAVPVDFGVTQDVDYTVVVSATAADVNFSVSGQITIYNPGSGPAFITDVSDVVDGAAANVDCGLEISAASPYEIAEGESLVCDYTADASGDEATNTADVATTGMIHGGSATVDVAWNTEPSDVIDECIDVTDDQYGDLGEVCADDLDENGEYKFSYTDEIGPFGDALEPGQCGTFSLKNIASFVTNDAGATGSDDVTVYVRVCKPELPPVNNWCSPGFWAQNYDNLVGTDYDITEFLNDPVPGFEQYTVQFVLDNGPSVVGGPAFNAAATYLSGQFGWDGVQDPIHNCPIDAHGIPKP